MPHPVPLRVVTMLVLASALACSAPAGNVENGAAERSQLVAADPVPDSVIVMLNTGIPDRRRLVIRSEAEWAALWREATANVSPAPALPRFDFGSEMLLVAAMGTRPSGGHAIAIDSVYTRAGILHAVVRETSPGDDCFVAAVITTPVVAVRVAETSAPVEFSTRTAVHSCQ